MAKKRTNKSKYQSKYGGGYITPAQYIVERICEHKANQDNTGLPYKFWNTKKWRGFFRSQMTIANGLLKLYSPEAIVAALRQPKAAKVYSLGASFILDDLFDAEQKKIDAHKKNIKKSNRDKISKDVTSKPVKFSSKKSKMNKLRALNGEKKKDQKE